MKPDPRAPATSRRHPANWPVEDFDTIDRPRRVRRTWEPDPSDPDSYRDPAMDEYESDDE